MCRQDAFTLDVLEVPQGSGSGFVWDKDGHIVTNYHVIRGASDLRLVNFDGLIFFVGGASDLRLVNFDWTYIFCWWFKFCVDCIIVLLVCLAIFVLILLT